MKTKATMPNVLGFQVQTPVGYTPRTCKWCGSVFMAKPADVKRGWGLFCTKSCKAKAQTARKNLPRSKPKPKAISASYDSFAEYDKLCAEEDKQNAKPRRG